MKSIFENVELLIDVINFLFRLTTRSVARLRRLEEKQRMAYTIFEIAMKAKDCKVPSGQHSDVEAQRQQEGPQSKLGTSLPSYTIAIQMGEVKAEADQSEDRVHAPAVDRPGGQYIPYVPQPGGHLPSAPEATINVAVKPEPTSPACSESGQVYQQRSAGGSGAVSSEDSTIAHQGSGMSQMEGLDRGVAGPITSTPRPRPTHGVRRQQLEAEAWRVSRLILLIG